MPSAKILAQKQAATEALTEKVKNAAAGVLVNYTGITVEQDTALRTALRNAGVDYHVYKNTMTGRACEAAGYGEMKQYLNGMNAFAVSATDPVAPAKILKKYIGEFKKCEFKAGIVDGAFYTADEVVKLADLPSKEELIAKMLGSLNAPISGLVRSLSGIIGGLGIVLNAIKEQKAEA